MGPKKGKGSRLSRMSEEERIRYMQHRAALEEEARRRKQALVAGYMKIKLRKEEGFQRLNSAKINQQWRALLRQAKARELQLEMEAERGTFRATVARQAAVVQSLQEQLARAERQYARGLAAHATAIDDLIKLHAVRLEVLYNNFKAERAEMIGEAAAEAEEAGGAAAAACQQLQVAQRCGESRHERFCRERRMRHQLKYDDVRGGMLSEYSDAVAEGDAVLERLWRRMREVLKGYSAATNDKAQQLRRLQQRDAEHEADLAQLNARAHQLEREVESLRRRLCAVKQQGAEEARRLAQERDTAQATRDMLRARLVRSTNGDRRKLEHLVHSSEGAIEELRRLEAKAAKVLSLAGLCRRLETLEEKVLPWGFEGPFAYDADADIPNGDGSDSDEKDVKVEKKAKGLIVPEMDRFWARYNAALLSAVTLRVCRDATAAEGRQLRAALAACVAAAAAAARERAAPGTATATPTGVWASAPLPARLEGSRAATAVPASRRHFVALPGVATPSGASAPASASTSSCLRRHPPQRRHPACVEAVHSVAVRFPISASGAW